MQRVFGLFLTVLVTVAMPSGIVRAQTQQQVQQKASEAANDATKAVDSANVQTQAAIAKPQTHKKMIAIIAVVVLILLLVLLSAMRGRRRKETIIQTRR